MVGRRIVAVVLAAGLATGLGSCRGGERRAVLPVPSAQRLDGRAEAFLDTLEERTFRYFWELSHPRSGLTPDRWPTRSFASTSATGFALTAYGIGAERGYVTRLEARDRVLRTLEFLWRAPQGEATSGAIGTRGFFYHFLDPATGHRFERVELSTVDTALLMAGVLFCRAYFDRDDPGEARIRSLADSLFGRVDWRWAQPRPPTIVLGWSPEEGFLPYDWGGYNEAMLVVLLALGSPTHPVAPEAWSAWLSGYQWGQFEGQHHVGFAPLFGHQFSHAWVDFRGVRDSVMRAHGIDYAENSRRATLAQRAYAIRNPGRFRDYGPELWGLSACDGPADTTVTVDGRPLALRTYAARGASFTEVTDDGTITPSAAGGSIAFAPEVVVPTLMAMRQRYGDHLFSRYGFVDALNPSLARPIGLRHGRIVSGLGWFDTDYLGIDQGVMLLMIENFRTGLVWERMRRDPDLARGLRRAGFTGGWVAAGAR
jgi:hypothetical protein